MPINVSYHPAKCGGHEHCGIGNMVLVCHVILQDGPIKGSCDFMGKSPLRSFSILPNLVAVDTCVSGDIMVLVCQHLARPGDQRIL